MCNACNDHKAVFMTRYGFTEEQYSQLLLMAEDPRNMPVYDRVAGVLSGNPLSREEEQFGQIEQIIRVRLGYVALADKLVSMVTEQGGLISREKALALYAERKAVVQA